MVVRIELERLRDRGLIRIERSGVELTDMGSAYYETLLEPILSIREVALTSLRLGVAALAAHTAIPECSAAWVLRDLAVREGAMGLLLLSRSDSRWRFSHDGEPIEIQNPEDAATIERTFPAPKDADRLVIAFGPTLQQAAQGLWHVLAGLVSLD